MLYDLIIATTGMALLMTGWYGFQAWIRHRSPEFSAECDVLEGRFGCGDCVFAGRCKMIE